VQVEALPKFEGMEPGFIGGAMTMSFFYVNILYTFTTLFNRYHSRQNFCASDDGIRVLVLDTLI
jgi:hypothetical protein